MAIWHLPSDAIKERYGDYRLRWVNNTNNCGMFHYVGPGEYHWFRPGRLSHATINNRNEQQALFSHYLSILSLGVEKGSTSSLNVLNQEPFLVVSRILKFIVSFVVGSRLSVCHCCAGTATADDHFHNKPLTPIQFFKVVCCYCKVKAGVHVTKRPTEEGRQEMKRLEEESGKSVGGTCDVGSSGGGGSMTLLSVEKDGISYCYGKYDEFPTTWTDISDYYVCVGHDSKSKGVSLVLFKTEQRLGATRYTEAQIQSYVTKNTTVKFETPLAWYFKCIIDQRTEIYRQKILKQPSAQDQLNLRVLHPNYITFLDRNEKESERVRSEYQCHLNVQYGTDSLQTLDIFPSKLPNSSIVVFIHGGYWHSLGKKSSYSFVAEHFVRNDVTACVVNYRLMPSVDMESVLGDIQDALCWIQQNAYNYNGNPKALLLIGHSAGGHLALMTYLLCNPELRASIRSICSLSGIFDLQPIRDSFLNETLQLTKEDVQRFSPIRHKNLCILNCGECPTRLSVGEGETDLFIQESKNMYSKLECVRTQYRLEYQEEKGLNHYQMVHELGREESDSTNFVLRWARILADRYY